MPENLYSALDVICMTLYGSLFFSPNFPVLSFVEGFLHCLGTPVVLSWSLLAMLLVGGYLFHFPFPDA